MSDRQTVPSPCLYTHSMGKANNDDVDDNVILYDITAYDVFLLC